MDLWTVPKESKNVNFVEKIAFVPRNFKYVETGLTSNIPRILHLIWVGENNAPESLHRYLNTWRALMPAWNIRLWTNIDINEFPEAAIALINTATKGAQKADIMRYFIIEKYGGVYMDADVIPNASLEPLLTNFHNANLIICHDIPLTWHYISIGFFAAAPGHPVLKAACSMCYNIELNTSDIHMKSGPALFGRAIAQTDVTELIYLLPSIAFYYNENIKGRFGTHTFAKLW